MPRTPRRPSEYDWHHVLNRGVDRASVFFDDRDRVDFLRVLADACERSGVEVHAYCLMTNHYHLMVRAPLTVLAAAMHRLGTTYTRHVNDRWERDGPLFSGRFHSVPIADEHQLLQCFRYIHRNPLPIVGEERLDAYRWSSHRCYLGLRRSPHWLQTDQLSRRFDGPEDYGAFVARGRPHADAVPNDIRHVVTALSCEFAELRPGEPLVRAITLVLADRHPEFAGHLPERLAFSTDSARYAARTRARSRFETDADFHQLVRRVEATFHLGSDPK